MKKLTTIFLTLTFLMSAVSCESENHNSIQDSSPESVYVEEDTSIKLMNHMTDEERQNVKIGKLTVFDHEQKSDSSTIPDDGVYLEIWTPEYQKEYWSHYLENNPFDVYFTKEKIQEKVDSIDENNENIINTAYVDGHMVSILPDLQYDGGEITYKTVLSLITVIDEDGTVHYYDENGNELTVEDIEDMDDNSKKFSNFEECKSQISKDIEYLAESGMIEQSEVKAEYERTIRAWEAIINKSYGELEVGITDSQWSTDPVWEIDHDATAEIAEFVSEISIYDEELDTDFIIHVTLPPDFDSEKTYPAYVLTDGVWRFGNHPELRKEMENEKSGDAILVSIGYDYSIDGMDNDNRKYYFCEKSKEFLDFITDNLMPYLGEQYNMDFSNSTLYGHSLGGTFTHYAIFNSDRYENQPFGNYIIGSPAFWSPLFLPYTEVSEYKNEYGYFDRNNTLEKRIFICAGEDEDPVYEEYYDDNDSTLEGVENLMKRLSDYGFKNVECKIYPDSGHYEFVPEMLKEVLVKFYPVCTE